MLFGWALMRRRFSANDDCVLFGALAEALRSMVALPGPLNGCTGRTAGKSSSFEARPEPQNQSLDRGDRAKVCRSDLGSGDHQIEFGLDRQHQINHIDRAQASFGEWIIERNETGDRVVREDLCDKSEQPIARRAVSIRHGGGLLTKRLSAYGEVLEKAYWKPRDVSIDCLLKTQLSNKKMIN